MEIQSHHVVSLTYDLYVNEPTQTEKKFVESATEAQPLVFLTGVGAMLPEFEQNLLGLKTGDTYSFSISSENGYGEYDETAIVGLDAQMFGTELPQIGEMLPLKDNQGNQYRGIVIDVATDVVKVDLNPPMAGKDLHFNGKIIGIRPATADEIAHGHVHGEGGHHH